MKRKDFIKLLAITPLLGMNIKALSNSEPTSMTTKKMPVMFVGHGNPMNALAENDTTRGWRQMVKGIKPLTILCISAHWETKSTQVTMVPKPKTIHDFGGFPQELFDIQYPAPGNPELGKEIIQNVHKVPIHENHDWGLDHGTWAVIMKMFPEADIPVLQLSLNYNMPPEEHYALAKELAFLRERGVLIVGSGNLIHNLRLAKWNSDKADDWAIEFDNYANELILKRDHKTLIKADKISTEAKLSIPTLEHYLPMLYILGLQDKEEQVTFFNEDIKMGSMAMRSFVIS